MSSLHSSGRCRHPRASRPQGRSRTSPSTCARSGGITRSTSASRRIGTTIRDCGPGQHRGGAGVSHAYRCLGPSTAKSVLQKTWGIDGGGEGYSNHIDLNPVIPSKIVEGGGWGDTYERDPALVAREVWNGIVSLEAARAPYVAVVDPHTPAVDGEATADLRTRKR